MISLFAIDCNLAKAKQNLFWCFDGGLENDFLICPFLLTLIPCIAEHISDALQTECAKCTEAQNKGAKRVIKHLINNEPGYWGEVVAKYDLHYHFF